MGRRRRWATPVVALVVALVALMAGGCGAPRVDPPAPEAPADAPRVAGPADDPADDPQLAALELPEGVPGVAVPPAGDDVGRLARLPDLAAALRAELGEDVEACRVEAGYALSVWVPTGGSVAEWRLGVDEGDDSLIQAQAPVSPGCDGTFPLAGLDLGVAARLADGALRRVPGATVTSATLAVDPGWGLSWRLGFARGGASATVVADVAGLVLAVTP